MTSTDIDGDRMLALGEMWAAMPGMSGDASTRENTDADGMIDRAEHDAGVEAGTIAAVGRRRPEA